VTDVPIFMAPFSVPAARFSALTRGLVVVILECLAQA
jgi:hypothetical protein